MVTTPESGVACTTRARSSSAMPWARRSPITSTTTRCSRVAMMTADSGEHLRGRRLTGALQLVQPDYRRHQGPSPEVYTFVSIRMPAPGSAHQPAVEMPPRWLSGKCFHGANQEGFHELNGFYGQHRQFARLPVL